MSSDPNGGGAAGVIEFVLGKLGRLWSNIRKELGPNPKPKPK
jgi:hypothetical protein